MNTYGACFYRFNEPGCFVWARVLDGGRVYIERDWKFIRKSVGVAAKEIRRISDELDIRKFSAVYGEPKMFPKHTEAHTSIEPESPSQQFAKHGLPMTPAGANVVHGWSRVHDYLSLAPDGKPWLIIGPDAPALARTLPTLTQSDTDPDDCEGELYAAHALRILLSARPSPLTLKPPKPVYPWGTIGWLKQHQAKLESTLRR